MNECMYVYIMNVLLCMYYVCTNVCIMYVLRMYECM